MARKHAVLGTTIPRDPTGTTGERKLWDAIHNASRPVTLESVADAVTTTLTSLTHVLSFVLPANTLRDNGESVEFMIAGKSASTDNNKTIAMTLGGSTLLTTGALAANAKGFLLVARVWRRAAAAQFSAAWGYANGAIIVPNMQNLTLALTGDLTFQVDVTDATAAAGTVIGAYSVVFYPQYLASSDS